MELSEISSQDSNKLGDKLSEHFEVLQFIAQGGFSEVYLVEKKSGIDKGFVYAAKIQKKKRFENTRYLAEWSMNEKNVRNLV